MWTVRDGELRKETLLKQMQALCLLINQKGGGGGGGGETFNSMFGTLISYSETKLSSVLLYIDRDRSNC